MKKIVFFAAIIALIISCETVKDPKTKSSAKNSKTITELVKVMQGRFSSKQQSTIDTSYYNINLQITPIWKDKGNYLYVEQALHNKLTKPYRVRVYKLYMHDNNKDIINEIYTLKNEKKWIGKWKTPNAFSKLTIDDIELKEGCDVIISKTADKKFVGKTARKTCISETAGASFAISKLGIYEDKIVSWDRGFNKSGKQVWGTKKGGYEFVKIK
jgi:CpeT protein